MKKKNKNKIISQNAKTKVKKPKYILNISYLNKCWGFENLKKNNGLKKMSKFMNFFSSIISHEEIALKPTNLMHSKNKSLKKYIESEFPKRKLLHTSKSLSDGARLHMVFCDNVFHLICMDMKHEIEKMH